MRVTRERRIAASPAQLWKIAGDPRGLPRWWPRVQRVEEVTDEGWTTVVAPPKGRMLRADYTLLAREDGSRLRWRHEVDSSPFERILSKSIYELRLTPIDDGAATNAELIAELALRGFARLGRVQIRRATATQFAQALTGLAKLTED